MQVQFQVDCSLHGKQSPTIDIKVGDKIYSILPKDYVVSVRFWKKSPILINENYRIFSSLTRVRPAIWPYRPGPKRPGYLVKLLCDLDALLMMSSIDRSPSMIRLRDFFPFLKIFFTFFIKWKLLQDQIAKMGSNQSTATESDVIFCGIQILFFYQLKKSIWIWQKLNNSMNLLSTKRRKKSWRKSTVLTAGMNLTIKK